MELVWVAQPGRARWECIPALALSAVLEARPADLAEPQPVEGSQLGSSLAMQYLTCWQTRRSRLSRGAEPPDYRTSGDENGIMGFLQDRHPVEPVQVRINGGA